MDTMAETKRVEFKTITPSKEEEKVKKRALIQRFTIVLGESTQGTCPEFSFSELSKKEKRTSGSVVDDPFGDGNDCHDEVAALAKTYEEKYGPKPSSKKKRKLKCLEDEYFDLGDGYDETDPFIDNTEAYDEVVPSCLTTKHGGFYINRGTLDFRNASEQEDSDEAFATPIIRKRGRPRKIMDSEDEEQEVGGETKKKKIKKKKGKDTVEGEPKKKKKKVTIGPDGEKIIKRRKVIDPGKKKKTSPTVKELLKQHTVLTASPGNLNGSMDEQSPSSPYHSPPGEKSTVQDKIDTVVSNSIQEEERKTNGSETGQNLLPSDLPAELDASIVDIKKAAKDSKEGKCRFFSPHVNKLLLDIELASRQLPHGKRPLVYAHLADHLPCGKETLIKRAKKLRENKMDDQLKMPIQQLKEEIDRVMPALQEQHEQEVAKVRLENREKREGVETPKEEGVNTESDEDDKNAGPGMSEGQSRKGNRDPRKKFQWTPKIKSLLCEIVTIKMHMFDTYKFRNQTAEEYLRTFLENEIKILWPQGWMQTRMLFKETRSVHGTWTNPVKPKRQMLASRSVTSPTPSQSANTSSVVTENSAASSLTGQPSQLASSSTEVIEVSDIDEPLLVPVNKDKPKAAPTVTDMDDKDGDNLKFFPNSVEAMAAATAAAVAAAVSGPKAEAHPSLGERRPHLMSEILKRPGGAEAVAAYPKSAASGPKITSASLTPQDSKAGISPYMAEFSRYLNSSSNTVPSTSPRQSQSLLVHPPSQVQSKTVSSSTGRPDDKTVRRQPAVQWPGEVPVSADKARKLAHSAVGSSRPPNAHSGHKGASLPTSSSMDNLSIQQAHLQKMTALFRNTESPIEKPQKSKGEIVRDQILAKLQAEIEASNATGSSWSGAGIHKLQGEVSGQKTLSHTTVSARSPSSVIAASQARQSPVPSAPSRQSPVQSLSSLTKHPGTGSSPGMRQPSPSVSRPSPLPHQSPTAAAKELSAVPRKAATVSSKQQTVVSADKTIPVKTGQGAGLTHGGNSKSLSTTFQSQQSSPSRLSPQSVRRPAPVRPVTNPVQKKVSPSPSSIGSHVSKSPTQSFQRTPTAQPPVRAAASQGQNPKVSPGQGRGNPQPHVSAGHNQLHRSSPTSLIASQRSISAMQSSNNMDVGRKIQSVPQGSQKISTGMTTISSAGAARSPATSQQLYMGNQMKPAATTPEIHRVSPGQRAAGEKAASTQPASQASIQGSKPAIGTPHSQSAVLNPVPGTSTPRLQHPAAATTKTVCSKPSPAHSGTSNSPQQNSGFSPQAVDPPKPPPGYGQ